MRRGKKNAAIRPKSAGHATIAESNAGDYLSQTKDAEAAMIDNRNAE